jgi:hypothetical protein
MVGLCVVGSWQLGCGDAGTADSGGEKPPGRSAQGLGIGDNLIADSHTDWYVPNDLSDPSDDPGPYVAFEQNMMVRKRTETSFFAAPFGIDDARAVSNSGGYIGLIEGGPGEDNIRRFSIWDAVDGSPLLDADEKFGCTRFGDEGVGWTCIASGAWFDQHRYRVRVERGDFEAAHPITKPAPGTVPGYWWNGTVIDVDAPTAPPVVLGRLFLAYRSGHDTSTPQQLGWGTSNFTEHFLGPGVCPAYRFTAVDLWAPRLFKADGSADGAVLRPDFPNLVALCPTASKTKHTSADGELVRVNAGSTGLRLLTAWNLPAPSGRPITQIDQDVTLQTLAAETAWLLEWSWTGSALKTGRVMLERAGKRFDGTVGDTVIFSMPGATGAAPSTGGACQYGAWDGTGYECRIPVTLSVGRKYRYEVARYAETTLFVTQVTDQTTGASVGGGVFAMPPEITAISAVSNSSEYHGDAPNCGSIPVSRALFEPPGSNLTASGFATTGGSGTRAGSNADLRLGGPIDRAQLNWTITQSATATRVNLDQDFVVRSGASGLSFGYSWLWQGAPAGGELAVQTSGPRWDGSVGPTAVFAWPIDTEVESEDPPSGHCFTSGSPINDLPWSTCRTPVPALVPGDRWRLRLERLPDDPSRRGTTWEAQLIQITSQGRTLPGGGAVTRLGRRRRPVAAEQALPERGVTAVASIATALDNTATCSSGTTSTVDFLRPAANWNGLSYGATGTFASASPVTGRFGCATPTVTAASVSFVAARRVTLGAGSP